MGRDGVTHVLIVDNAPTVRETLRAFLEADGYTVSAVADFFAAEPYLTRSLLAVPDEVGGVDIVVADVALPRVGGLELLQRVRQMDENIIVILITDEPDVSTAAEALRLGAYDYISKPVNQEMLSRVVGRAAEKKDLSDDKRRLEMENLAYQAELEKRVAERTVELELRNRELAALIEFGRGMSATLEISEVLKRVAQRAAQICGAHRCTILMLSEDGQTLTPLMSQFSDGHLDDKLWQLFQDASYPMPAAQIGESQTVIGERQPVFIDEIEIARLPPQWIEPFGVKSVLIVPLVSQDRVVGAMALDCAEEGCRFTEVQVNLAMAIASQAAVAIENARLYEETRRRAEELATLEGIAHELTTTLDYQRVLDLVLDKALAATSASIGLVAVFDRRSDGLLVLTSRGFPPEFVERYRHTSWRVERGIVGRVARTGESVLVPDVTRDADYHSVVAEVIRSELVVPIRLEGRVMGVLDLESTELGGFDRDDQRFIEHLAKHASVAMENARLFQSEQKRASQLTVVNQVARRIASILDLDPLLHEVVQAIQVGFGYYNVTLCLLDEEAAELTVSAIAGGFEWPSLLDYRQSLGAGILGWVARAGKPVLANDVSRDPHYIPGFLEEGLTNSELCVPLKLGDRVIGVLDVQDTQLNAFDETDLTTLETMADQIALAIETARLYGEVKRWAEEMTMLYQTSLEIGGPMELPSLLWKICDRAAKLLNVNKGGLYLYDESRDALELVVPYKLEKDFTGTHLKLGEGIAGKVAQTGESLFVDDYTVWQGRARAYDGEGFGSVIGVPLKWQGRVIGAVTLAGEMDRRAFTPDDERLLDLFTQQAALAVQNSRLYDDAKRHVKELTILHQIDIAITSSLNLEDVLTIVYEQVNEVMHPTSFYIGLYEEDRDEMHVPIWMENGERQPPLAFKVGDGRGLSEWVLRTGESLVIRDLESERELLPVQSVDVGTPSHAMMVFPLVVKERVIGVIAVQSDRAYAFDAGHRRLFAGIARQVAIAVENARLFEAAKRRANELSSLHGAAVAISSSLELEEVLRTLAEQVGSALEVSSVYICDWDEEAETTTILARWVSPDATKVERVADLGATYAIDEYPTTLRALREKRPALLRATDPDLAASDREGAERYGWQTMMVVPLVSRDRVIGYAELWETRREREFSTGEVQLCQTLAADAAVAIENARLYQETARHVRDLRLLADASAGMMGALAPQKVVDHLLSALVARFGAPCGVVLLDRERREATLVGAWMPEGKPFSLPIGSRMDLSERWGLAPIVQARRLVYIPDVEQSEWWGWASEFEQDMIRQEGIKATLIAPLVSQERVMGIVSLKFYDPLPEPVLDQLDWVQALVNQAAAALVGAQFYQELEEKAEELSRAYAELQEIHRLRTELVQNVGHELRTPLGLIKGYVELLLMGDLGDMLESQQNALHVVYSHVATLERLIHNLTMLQMVPRGALALVPMALDDIVRQAVIEFEGMGAKIGVRFRDELPPRLPLVCGDQERLKVVFSHLLDNAVKFSPDGGLVTIMAWSEGGMVYVSVSDEGVGIPSEHIGRLFERFYQVDGSTTRRFGGMGVGLALVWEIVEAHGGTVTVESQVGEGSTFTVALPQIAESVQELVG